MPRCAVVLSTFRPVTGGYQRQLEAVFAVLSSGADWDVEVITRSQPNAAPRDLVAGLPVRRVGASGKAFALGAWRRLVDYSPQAVVTAQVGSAALAASMFCAPARRPLVIRLAGSEVLHSTPARLIQRLAPHAVLVAPSQHQVDALGAAGWRQRRAVIANGVSVPVADSDPEPAVVWYGRDSHAKHPAYFEALLRAQPDVRFWALGDATLGDWPNLRRIGWVEDAATVLADARAFVSTSRSEGSPNVALQALAMGRAVAAVDIPAYRELRSRFPEHVYVAPPGDVQALAAQVRRAVAAFPLPPARVPTIEDAAREWDRLLRGLL